MMQNCNVHPSCQSLESLPSDYRYQYTDKSQFISHIICSIWKTYEEKLKVRLLLNIFDCDHTKDWQTQ